MLGFNPIDQLKEEGGVAFTILGHALDVGTSVESIWPPGGKRPLPVSAITMEIVSADANDTIGGSGARTVLVQGLAADFSIVEQEVNMNGTTAVQLPTDLFRILRVRVLTAGTNASPEGDISVQASPGGTVYEICETSENLSRSAVFTVPKGRYAYITQVTMIGGTSREATAALFAADAGSSVFIRSPSVSVSTQSPSVKDIEGHPGKFEEGADMEFLAFGTGAGSEVQISATVIMKIL